MEFNENNNEQKVCDYKVEKCLKCGAETDPKDERELFCSQCGAPVLNVCSNYDCQEMLKGNAKYCKLCGSSSIFTNYGLFGQKPAKPILPQNDLDDLPF